MKTFDVIIPHTNLPAVNRLAAACVESVRRNSADYRVIWIQNGGEIPAAIGAELARCEQLETIRNAENLGFVKAVNQGLRLSDAPFLVILNNDTRVCPGWLLGLRAPLLSGNFGLSGPLSTARGSWQGRTHPRVNPWKIPDHLNLAFFCVMLRRDALERVGLLDEGFGLGLGDDDDYCVRARAAGYDLALVTNLKVVHRHRSTFREMFTAPEIRGMQLAAVSRIQAKGMLCAK